MFWDKERAEKAYNKVPKDNINSMMTRDHYTEHSELRVRDHRVSFQLRRIADLLEDLVEVLKK